MFKSIRNVFVLAVAAGLTWGCGGERVTTSQIPEADHGIGQPLGKLAAGGGVTPALVVARVMQGQTPQGGVNVAFARSVSGRTANYEPSGATDANGLAQVEIESGSGYYRALATRDGNQVGSWSSIPINAGYEVMLDLPVGDRARVTGSSPRVPGYHWSGRGRSYPFIAYTDRLGVAWRAVSERR